MKIPLKRKLGTFLTIAIAILVFIAYIYENTDIFKNSPVSNVNGECSVHFIDVGQGDCTLIQCGGYNVLIDAGENNKGDEVLLKLTQLGVKKLDYIIGTHAHSDHIGGLDTVINSIKTDNIILSDLPDDLVPTTVTYTDLLEAIVNNDVNLIAAEPEFEITLGDGKITLLAPLKEYNDLNDYSIVTRFDFGETSFLITGDAEKGAESDILKSGADVSATVLKVGHHGSETSTSYEFLQKVKPKYAVIEVGVKNKYDHPSPETLSRLMDIGAKIFRTDLNGNITAVSDGKAVTFTTDKE